MQTVIVIYYDGNENRATVTQTDTPDSSQAHVFGLDPDYDVVAVVALDNSDLDLTVYIEEEVALEYCWERVGP